MKNCVLYGVFSCGIISFSTFLMGSNSDEIKITPAMQVTFQQALNKATNDPANDTNKPKESEQQRTEQKGPKKKLKQAQKENNTEQTEESNLSAVTDLLTEHFSTHVPDSNTWTIFDPNLPTNRTEYEKYIKVLTMQKPVQFLNHILADFIVPKIKPYIVSKKKLHKDATLQMIETHYHTGTNKLPVTILFDPDLNKPVSAISAAFTFDDGMTKFVHIMAEANGGKSPTRFFLLKKRSAADQAKHETALHT